MNTAETIDIVARWRTLRSAVREAHALGVGAAIEIDGHERLPEKLLEALDPDLLYEYFGPPRTTKKPSPFSKLSASLPSS